MLLFLLKERYELEKKREEWFSRFRAASETSGGVFSPNHFDFIRSHVLVQLTDPASAVFGGEEIRACADGQARAFGHVDFSGKDGARDRNWYIATIDPQWNVDYFDMFDVDPIARADAEAARKGGYGKFIWPILWILVTILFILVLIWRWAG